MSFLFISDPFSTGERSSKFLLASSVFCLPSSLGSSSSLDSSSSFRASAGIGAILTCGGSSSAIQSFLAAADISIWFYTVNEEPQLYREFVDLILRKSVRVAEA